MSGCAWQVLVVDDHRMVCELMAATLENWAPVKRVFCALSPKDALLLARQHRLDVALIDARMPGTSGIEFMKQLKAKYPHVKCVGMTSFEEDETLAEMLQTGVHGLLLKRGTSRQEIRHCVQEVMEGRSYFSSQVSQKITASTSLLQPPPHLTKREFQILQLICQGHSTKQIADLVQLKEMTVDDYRKKMLLKTHTKNAAELVAFAHRNGLV
ncbi:MAG: response regulator [Cyclobacteriaceae bacterium]|jgi:DNA-binding NarL/FixJ family response regulator